MSNQPSSDQEAIDSLKFIAETHRRLFEQRLQRTTRLAFSTLTFYVLAVGARFGAQNSSHIDKALQQPVVITTIWILFVGIALFAGVALRNAGRADLVNRTIAEKAENAIIELLHAKGHEILPTKSRHANPNSLDLAWKTILLILFSLAAAAILTWA